MKTHIIIVSKSIEYDFIEIQGSMSDPTFSDIDFKKKMGWVWTAHKLEVRASHWQPILFLFSRAYSHPFDVI